MGAQGPWLLAFVGVGQRPTERCATPSDAGRRELWTVSSRGLGDLRDVPGPGYGKAAWRPSCCPSAGLGSHGPSPPGVLLSRPGSPSSPTALFRPQETRHGRAPKAPVLPMLNPPASPTSGGIVTWSSCVLCSVTPLRFCWPLTHCAPTCSLVQPVTQGLAFCCPDSVSEPRCVSPFRTAS